MVYYIVIDLLMVSTNYKSTSLDCIRLSTIDYKFITVHYNGLQALSSCAIQAIVRLVNIEDQHEGAIKVENQSFAPVLGNYEVDRQ